MIQKIEILPELPVSPIPNFKQTLLPVVNTLNKILLMDTEPNKEALKRKKITLTLSQIHSMKM